VTGSIVRRSGRLQKEIDILLSGSDIDGRQFSERTKTLVLSKHGASVLSTSKLIPQQEVYVRLISDNREAEVRVCGEIGEREDGHIYGIAFTDAKLDFWGMEFPPPERIAISLKELTLECSSCKTRTVVNFDVMELDVLTVNEGVLRFCDRCRVSTIWKRASEEPAAATSGSTGEPQKQEVRPGAGPAGAVAPSAGTSAPAGAATTAPAGGAAAVPNRRRDRRMKTKVNAAIRGAGGREEIVECLDMSKGGFGFRSAREYSVDARIEAAVPYSPDGSSIFVPAKIANVSKIEKTKMYRYGAAYLRGAM